MASRSVAVLGASGYAGAEIARLLAHHPALRLRVAAAGASAGQTLGTVHPQLTGLPGADLVLCRADAAPLGEVDVVFLALPAGQSAAVVERLDAEQAVVDLGADHRLGDAAAWDSYYAHATTADGSPARHAGQWLYGLPELPGTRDALPAARRVANPGCFPTAVVLGLAPLLAAGLVEPDDVVVVAATGTSGAGRSPSVDLLASEVAGSARAYRVGGHQHTPEIEQALAGVAGSPVTVSFTSVLAPMPRGILATSTARMVDGVDAATVHDALRAAYAGEAFVHVLPPGQWPASGSTTGSNAVHLQATVDPHAGRVIVVAALDNLVKGAAGQAVQNANLMLGLAETAGLAGGGVAP